MSCGGVAVNAALRDDRRAVLHFRLVAVHVLQRIVVAEQVLDVEALEIRGPAFLNPHVRHVGGGDRVAEPLVRALVNDDEVELQADADAGPVAFEVAVGEAVAVGDRALVLHAGVRHFDQLVAVLLERILAEEFLVAPRSSASPARTAPSPSRGCPAARRNRACRSPSAIGEVHVVADVQRHVVGVDRVVNAPVPARVAVAEIGLADEPAVRDVDQIVRDGDAQLHPLRLVAPLILVRPPDAGALPLARGGDPVLA